MQALLTGSDALSMIGVSVATKEQMSEVREQTTAALIEKHRVDPQAPDFSIVSQADIVEHSHK